MPYRSFACPPRMNHRTHIGGGNCVFKRIDKHIDCFLLIIASKKMCVSTKPIKRVFKAVFFEMPIKLLWNFYDVLVSHR